MKSRFVLHVECTMRKSRYCGEPAIGSFANRAGWSKRGTGRLPGTIGSRLNLAARTARLLCRRLSCARRPYASARTVSATSGRRIATVELRMGEGEQVYQVRSRTRGSGSSCNASSAACYCYGYKRNNRAAGFCPCGRFRERGRQACRGCLSHHRDAQRRRRAGGQISHIDKGVNGAVGLKGA